MSYRIQYHLGPAKTEKKSRHALEIPVVALLILISALAVNLVLPVQIERLRDTLFPWTQEQVQEALALFRDNIASGASFGDSVTAFCAEIVDEAS